MNRTEWQQLAEVRLRDAKALLDAGRWSAAYYLAGYAVEFALKSCVLAHVERTGALLGLADLKAGLDADCQHDHVLGQNRQLVKDWKETSRYEQRTQAEAEGLYNAVANNQNGVSQWIRNHW